MNEETAPKNKRLKKLRQMMTWICIALAVVTLFGHAGRFWWLFDLFSHFRLQLSLSCLVVAVVLFFTGTRIYAGIALLFCVVNIAGLWALFTPVVRASIPDDASTFRLFLCNMHFRSGDSGKVLKAVQTCNPDIVVLQEFTFNWLTELEDLRKRYPHEVVVPRDDTFGIAVYSRIAINKHEIVRFGDAGPPSIHAQLQLEEDRVVHLLATHPMAPIGGVRSGMRNDQLEKAGEFAKNLRSVILAGDLNTTPWNYHFRNMRKKAKLLDSSNGFGYQSTWPRQVPLLSIPLDHVLHSNEIVTVNRQIGPDVGSDHFPVIVDLVLISPDDDSQK